MHSTYRMALAVFVAIAPSLVCIAAQPPATNKGVAAREDLDFEKIRTRNPEPDRYGKFTQIAAKGPHMKVLTASCFGTESDEQFTAVAVLADGAIAACGNAKGPQFPQSPASTVLGKAKGTAEAPLVRPVALVQPIAAKGRRPAAPAAPAAAGTGFVAFYDAGVTKVERLVRFDWGLASMTAAVGSGDGKAVIVAGAANEGFDTVGQNAGQVKTQGNGAGAFVMRLSADGKVEWLWVLGDGKPAPTRIWADKQGAVYFDSAGLRRINADGKELSAISDMTGKWLGIDPKDGSAYFGGDRNTRTNREPWRQPYLYRFDSSGKKLWTLWEVPSKTVGSDMYGLESDSSIRAVATNSKGELIVGGWSDGGNTILPRKANDFKHYCPEGGMGMLPWWPKGASSFAHLIRLDPNTLETKSHQWWLAYIPMNFIEERPRNAPNGISIESICILADDSVALVGGSATGLIQTPNAFWKDPGKGEKYGGSYVAVFDPTMTQLRFSSYVPGCSNLRMAATRDGLVVVGKTTGADAVNPQTATPLLNEIQKFAGGTDGEIILLRNP